MAMAFLEGEQDGGKPLEALSNSLREARHVVVVHEEKTKAIFNPSIMCSAVIIAF